jgi:hypothetical protein
MEIRSDDGIILGAPVESVERYAGERSVLGRRLLIGAAVGAGLGFGLTHQEQASSKDEMGTRLLGAAAMASMGMVVAAVIPNRTMARWEPVQAPPGRMGPTLSLLPGYDGRVRITLNLNF